MHLKCIFFHHQLFHLFSSSAEWPRSHTPIWWLCSAIQTMQILQKRGPDHRNHQGGRGCDLSSDVSRQDTDVQACIEPEVRLVFYAHWEPRCWNSLLADGVKCITVYWFFTPLQKWCVLCAPKMVWDIYRYFKAPPQRVTKTETKRPSGQAGTVASRQWQREAVNHRKSPRRSIWRNSDRAVEARGQLAKIGQKIVCNILTKTFFGEIKHLPEILESP